MDPNSKTLEFPPLEELTFDEIMHRYYVDGTEVPSVSRVMEPLKDANYAGISDKTLKKAADKGTAVHDAIENFVKFGIEDINPEYKPYYDAFMSWWQEKRPIVVGSEIRVYHKLLGYAGTIDLLCYIDDLLTLIDFKTTYTVSDMSCGVQLEAYAKALESHGIKVDQKMILHLKRDGRYKPILYPANDSKRWRVFGSLKVVYDYIQSYKK